MRPACLLSLLLLVGAHGRAEPLRLHSGPQRVALVELYTSEGCSSCPPAERWLGRLHDAPGLWRDFVPVAFHVDYWNRLGWPDRFSSQANTRREYAYAAAWHSESVYTPCFVRNGAEWHTDPADLVADDATTGTLEVTYDGATLRAEYQPAGSAAAGKETYEIHAALLGGGIASKVTAGENRGEMLHHEFVALRLASGAPGEAIALPRTAEKGVTHYGLAVWVTHAGALAPLQAVGGWLE